MTTVAQDPTPQTSPLAVNALFVQPRFQDGSFWNYKDTCALVGAKYPAPPLGLITVAAMLPEHWTPRLVDRNIEDLTDADLDWADVVMTGGMLPQQLDINALIARCHARGLPVVVGGPDPTSAPENYASADFRVLGEVESIIHDFVAAFDRGDRQGEFIAEKFKADVTTTPIPRYDLLTFDRYLQVSVQFSRGCPFLCEFCDIIELYGRNPRAKPPPQMLQEFQRLFDLGYRGMVDIVDDNLIGNKKAAKLFLPHLIEWQRAHGYPFELSTEASLNLADDDEFLSMLRDANFIAIFVGIESPDPDVLVMAQKKQNTKRDIAQGVHKIQSYGILVVAGFIVGFDNEKPGTGAAIVDLIEDAAIPVAMAGLLFALPNTQLSRRLATEGRLDDLYATVESEDDGGDQCTAGLNFETTRPRADVLRDYREVIASIYTPEAFFRRVADSIRHIDASGENGKLHRARLWIDTVHVLRLYWNASWRSKELRAPLWRLLFVTLRRNPKALKHALYQAALFAHLGPFARRVLSVIDLKIADAEREAAEPPKVRKIRAIA